MGFKYDKIKALGITMYRTTCKKGEESLFDIMQDIRKEDLPNVLVFAGSFTYGPFPTVGNVYLVAGSTGEDLPNRSKGQIKMVALEDNATYFCIHRSGPFGKGPRPNSKKIDVSVGELLEVPKGRIAVLGRGSFTLGGIPVQAPYVLCAEKDTISVKVTERTQGLEVWS